MVTGTPTHPRSGVDYPRSVGEFQAWFSIDADWMAGHSA
jgi:hypothetical protein